MDDKQDLLDEMLWELKTWKHMQLIEHGLEARGIIPENPHKWLILSTPFGTRIINIDEKTTPAAE